MIIIASFAWADKAFPKEYENFGKAITDSLIAGDQAAIQSAINEDAVMERIFKDIALDTDFAKGVKKGVSESVGKLGGILVSQMQDQATLKFVRARHNKDGYFALVRVDFGDQGLNYLDFALEKDTSGAIKIVDWYDYVKGQLYSDSVRSMMALIMPKERNLLEKILGINKLDKDELATFVDQLKLFRDGDYKGSLLKYYKLPKRMRQSRIVLVTRAMAANASGDQQEYSLALEDLNTYFGDDPTLGLILLDHFYMKGDYKNAKKSLKELAEYTGGDAAIDNLMANISQAEKNYTESIEHAKHAIKSDPEYVDAYFTLLDSSVYAANYKDAVKTIDKLETDFGFEFDPEKLTTLEGYEGFAASKEFKKWRDAKEKDQ